MSAAEAAPTAPSEIIPAKRPNSLVFMPAPFPNQEKFNVAPPKYGFLCTRKNLVVASIRFASRCGISVTHMVVEEPMAALEVLGPVENAAALTRKAATGSMIGDDF
jgi:hypothetical protein